MTAPVTPERIDIAFNYGLDNADLAALACRVAELPYWAACALLEKESMGRNIYGHDAGGALSGYPYPVVYDNWAVFRWLVIDKGQSSNGVGPCQITWAGMVTTSGSRTGGFFTVMEGRGLQPWNPEHNMEFGFELLWKNYLALGHSWVAAGKAYNGSELYGWDLLAKCADWKRRLNVGGPLEP